MLELSLAIVGADHANKSGPTRRFEIAMCKPGDAIELRVEPNNSADPHAVGVFSQRGIQLGYVRAERAPVIGRAVREGRAVAIFQQPDKWGCTVRVRLDGKAPNLPQRIDMRAADWPPPGSEDADWWPDEEWLEGE